VKGASENKYPNPVVKMVEKAKDVGNLFSEGEDNGNEL